MRDFEERVDERREGCRARWIRGCAARKYCTGGSGKAASGRLDFKVFGDVK